MGGRTYRIYVAGKETHRADVAEVMRALRNAGHEITRDWTGLPPHNDDLAIMTKYASGDLEAVRRADVLVLLPRADLSGANVELGAALILGKPCYLLGTFPPDNIFWPLATTVVDLHDLIARLATVPSPEPWGCTRGYGEITTPRCPSCGGKAREHD